MEDNKGWICLHRKLLDHYLWQEKRKFSKAEAWIDMLMVANHSDMTVLIGLHTVHCGRGQSLLSLQNWANRWQWSKKAVHRLFALLERDGMVEVENLHFTTRITLCNYDTFQSFGHARETRRKRKGNKRETTAHPNNKNNKENNKNNNNKSSSTAAAGFDFSRKKDETPGQPKEQAVNHKSTAAKVQAADPALEQAWKGWKEHWQESNRKKMTAAQEKAQLRELHAKGAELFSQDAKTPDLVKLL